MIFSRKMRWPLLFGCALALGLPASARAQSPDDPLRGCKVGNITNTGGRDINNEKQTGVVIGAVQIVCDDTSIFAEEVSWNEKTLFARGAVLVRQEGSGLFVTAERMEMDRQTRLGTFYEFSGTARLTERTPEQSLFGTMEPEVMFRGEKLEKIGPRTYRLTKGSFSTCVQPTPRWQMHGTTGTVTLDERFVLKNAVLRVKGVPVFYLPYLYVPLDDRERSTGFLLPTYGASTVRGTGLSNAFFLTLGRSQDMTFYHDWFSKAGQGVGAEYNYAAAPGSGGDVRFYMLDENARTSNDGSTVVRAASRSYDLRANVNQALPRGFRLLGRANYFSDITTQQLYEQNVFDFSQRDRYLGATIVGAVGRYRIAADVYQRDVYSGQNASRAGRAPQIKLTMSEKPIGRSPVYFGVGGEMGYLVRRDDVANPETDYSLWRFDAAPTIRAPLSRLAFLSVSTAATWRFTHWLESIDPLDNIQVPVAISRHLLDLSADVVGPVFSRVFTPKEGGYAERFKHLIEPRLRFQWLSPFDRRPEVVQIDGVDTPIGGTTTLTYSLTNRVLARRRTAGVQSILTVSLAQSYYTKAQAAIYDPQYQTAASGAFSPIHLNVSVAPTDEVTGSFQMYIHPKVRKPQSYGALATIYRQNVQVSAGWSKRQFLPGVPGFDSPASASHQLNASTTLKLAGGRVGGTYGLNYDVKNRSFVQQRFVVYYNAQCCGVSVDYQTLGISHLSFSNVRNDRRFGISFTLAGIGSFANPMGSFGDNGGRR